MNRFLISMFTIPLMLLCGLALMSGIFLMSEGFKAIPVDPGRGLMGVGLLILAVICFPSRQHILYRLWVNRRRPSPAVASPSRDQAPPPPARPAVIAQIPRRSPGPPAALYDGRVRLDIVLPPDPAQTTSWLGGLPQLPPEIDWPATADGPMLFVAQIALADLPQAIWGGLGPRTGSLAFFVHADDDFGKVAVLHLQGRLQERDYPAPLEVIQAYPILKTGPSGELLAAPPDTATLPLMKWPVRATPIGADVSLPHPCFKYRASDNPGAVHRKTVALSDPAFVPYDWSTAIALVTALIGDMNGTIHRDGSRPDMPEALRQSHADRRAAATALTGLRTALRRSRRGTAFTPQDWTDLRLKLDSLHIRRTDRATDPSTGQVLHTLRAPEPVLNCLPALSYYAAFDYLARAGYTRAPASLPAAVRASFEPVWRFDAAFEVAQMGGRIDIAAHVTAPRDDLVCLFEMPKSELVGTMWHDLSSLGVFIDPESLAEGRLDRAMGSMTE